jgi:DNA polymerase IV
MTSTLCRDCLTHIKTDADAGAVCATCGSARMVRHAELEDLDIAHVDCDAFYASVEKRDNPSIRDKPLIVGHPGGRGVVTTACYIARKFGPRSAMPMFKALEMCPDAVVIKPNMAKYKEVSQQIRAIFHEATPVIEPVSLDEAYLDLSAETRGDGLSPAWHLARIARRIETDVGITVSVGLSYNRFLAKLASDMEKPHGFSIIPRAGVREFLAPLPVRKINGVGEATAKKMETDQINTIGDLQALPEAQLVTRYGKFGNRLVQYARGEGSRRITPSRPSKSISAENTFRHDTRSLQDLLAAIEPMCDTVARRLDRSKLAGGTVVVKLKTGDFQTLTRNRKLANPTQRADILYQSASQLIEKEANGRAFRLIGVGVADLCPATQADPPDLFGGML